MGSVRLTATRYIWVAFVLAMAVTFSDVIMHGSSPQLGHIIIAAIVAAGAFLSTGMVWNWGDAHFDDALVESGKSKRQESRTLDRVLDRLSEEERDILRERLNADADAGYMLTDDGELAQRRSS